MTTTCVRKRCHAASPQYIRTVNFLALRILFFTENLRAGGKERRIVELLRHLTNIGGFQVSLVLTADIIHYEEIHLLGIPIQVVKRRWIRKDPSLFFRFYRIAKDFRPDIIHVWGHMTAVYAVPSSILLNVPLINNEIVDATKGKTLLFRNAVFHFSQRIIANSTAGLLAYGAPKEKSAVIRNGFAADRLSKPESEELIRKRFGIATSHVIAMVASFLPYKDYRTYLDTAIRLCGERNDVTFLCIGDGDDTEYRAKVPGHLTGRILFTGRQSNVESVMNICTAGVLTTDTRYHDEGISNALMEFMALGKPVIATRTGGSPELIDDGVTGFLIEPFSAGQLTNMIIWLLEHPGLRKTMGIQARQVIATRFSMDLMVGSFLREYRNAAGNPSQTVITPAA